MQPKDDEELVWRAAGLLHEAEMEDEMILGYPWLCQHRLAVVPSDHALGVGSLTVGLRVGRKVTRGSTRKMSGFRTVRSGSCAYVLRM